MTEEQLELIIKILGYLVLITALASMQVKKMAYLVILQCASNIFVVTQYLLRGEFSAMGICTLGAILTLMVFFFNIKEKSVPIPILVFFIVAGIGVTIGVIIGDGGFDPRDHIVPLVAWVFFNVAMMQSKSWIARALMTVNSSLWLLHNVVNFNLSLIITYSVLVITSLIGILRLDRAEWKSFLQGMFRKKED